MKAMPRLAASVVMLPALVLTQTAQHPPKIVFVCEHGSAKSVIAAAHFERMARDRGLKVQVIARGTVPDAEIGPAVRKGLKADGIDISDVKPTAVTARDLRDATKIISFGPDLAAVNERKSRVEDWSETPAVSADYDGARTYIVKRLRELLDELAAANH
jgi:arsenate reductase